MLVGVAFLPPSFPPSGTFYIIKRENCLNVCNTVYLIVSLKISTEQWFVGAKRVSSIKMSTGEEIFVFFSLSYLFQQT